MLSLVQPFSRGGREFTRQRLQLVPVGVQSLLLLDSLLLLFRLLVLRVTNPLIPLVLALLKFEFTPLQSLLALFVFVADRGFPSTQFIGFGLNLELLLGQRCVLVPQSFGLLTGGQSPRSLLRGQSGRSRLDRRLTLIQLSLTIAELASDLRGLAEQTATFTGELRI